MERPMWEIAGPTRLGKVVSVGGVAVILFAFLGLRISSKSEIQIPRSAAFARVIGGDGVEVAALFQEQAELFDTAPLFLPTAWNYSGDLGDILRIDNQSALFAPFPPFCQSTRKLSTALMRLKNLRLIVQGDSWRS